MEIGNAYIPMDWRHVFANNSSLEENQTGAALFADISGFTPLTEAFALELGPKRGGEELTVHLNRVYDGLIGVLHRYGGSVVSFSGDAITCWLDGDLDGRHAVRCAIEMQAVMNTVAQIVTPAGQEIILGLKVAVAVGSVKRFIVGLPEYTLMDAMAGKTVESVASAEQVAERGDVVIDRATFDVLEPHLTIKEWRVDEDSEDSFAVVESFALEPKESPWETLDDSTFTQTMIEHWLLPAVGTRISGGMGEFLTELRPAAALFIRFTGIDYDNDPEAPLKLNSFVQMVQRIMMRFEGSLLQLTIGDKGSYLYAAFGSPIAHEDDIDRAALASLALQHETKQLDYIEPIQIGISHGRMRTGAYGAVQRRTYGVLGDHVNLSARLMSKAPSGQIYMSHAAYRKIKDKFIWEPLQPMTVKGKSYTINAYRLLRRRQRQSFKLHEPVYRLPMVGRQAELNKIAQKIDRVLEGNGQIIGITADAGMGKSRLATEVIRTAFEVGLDGFAGECQSFGTNTSYLVWQAIWRAWFDLPGDEPAEDQIDLVRSYLKEADPAYLSRLPLLAPVLNLPIPDNELTATLDAKTKKSSLESLLVELVRYRAQGQPFLIVLEDCHWLDDLSKELIYEIGKFIENLPVMMLMVYRLPDTQREQLPKVHELPFFTEVSLNHFTSEEAARLIDLKIDEFFGKNQAETWTELN
ncbi:MAG: adenylate/guanylate cyclase domain-containing protein [Chloroflexota bacterium]